MKWVFYILYFVDKMQNGESGGPSDLSGGALPRGEPVDSSSLELLFDRFSILFNCDFDI